jgi:RNA binding protein fox-1
VTANLELGSDTITSKRSVKYLGVMIDDRLNFTSHVDYICEKASKAQTALARLMPNKFGARSEKRKLIANVVTSILRYGGEAWIKALESERNRDKINSVHRLATMRVISAYRTVSYSAACVIAGMMPICQLITEDQKCGQSKRSCGSSERTAYREQSIQQWQEAWDTSSKARWTYRLIPKIKPWLFRTHGEISYHLTQFLTGHGAFGSYLHRQKKIDTSLCPTCVNAEETPEHVVFECSRFDTEREDMTRMIPIVSVDNVVELMCNQKEYWAIINTMITKIISKLEAER